MTPNVASRIADRTASQQTMQSLAIIAKWHFQQFSIYYAPLSVLGSRVSPSGSRDRSP